MPGCETSKQVDGVEAISLVLSGELDVLKRPQADTATGLDALLPALLVQTFKGGL